MRHNEIFCTTTGSLILEAPQEIAPTDFNLDDRANNSAFAARQMKRVTEVIENTADYQLVRTGDQQNGWILLINKKDKTADYVVQYRVRHWRLLPTTVTQCVLWRDVAGPHVRGLTMRVFFDYLLQHHNTITSDGLQTKAGNDFWIGRMVDAVSKNKRVAVANLYHRTLEWFDPNGGQSLRDWLDAKHTYGPKSGFQGIRYLIAN
jgi:hypothetical protein